MTNKQLKHLKIHKNAAEAVAETTKSKIIAVVVKTYLFDSLTQKDYYSYKSKFENPEDLREDFPLALGSNQSIEELETNYN
jgi:hypothetical protein